MRGSKTPTPTQCVGSLYTRNYGFSQGGLSFAQGCFFLLLKRNNLLFFLKSCPRQIPQQNNPARSQNNSLCKTRSPTLLPSVHRDCHGTPQGVPQHNRRKETPACSLIQPAYTVSKYTQLQLQMLNPLPFIQVFSISNVIKTGSWEAL